ncbi:SRPBCC family protein [Streptomyces sp. NBC_00669]|uniref:SRPBCC family protein n=1 Tax=unclassified Streptomyces TaxID=2593676 RepID=UPI002E36667B|nr:SRPBCC family protein [Streptomyces sp. NBC_00669]
MALFVIERTSALPPAEAWRRLTTWERHSATVPLTRIEVLTPPPSGVGTAFVARTAVGRAGFADPMRVEVWQPPGGDGHGRCRLVKTGRVVVGWAEIEVGPAAGATRTGSRVCWREDLRVRGLPGALFDPVTSLAGRLVFGRVLDTLLAGRP